MKNTFIIFLLIFAATNISFSTTHTINNSGFTFSPNSITIMLGDTVNFVLELEHTAREVDEATWNNNETLSNGGFDLPNGGGIVVLTTEGIHYYVCVPHASSGMKGTITVNTATDVNLIKNTVPDNFNLMQNYPNPFNPSTRIRYSIPREAQVTIKLFDLLGKEVKTLVTERQQAGTYEVDLDGGELVSGIYVYQLRANNFIDTKKMILLR